MSKDFIISKILICKKCGQEIQLSAEGFAVFPETGLLCIGCAIPELQKEAKP